MQHHSSFKSHLFPQMKERDETKDVQRCIWLRPFSLCSIHPNAMVCKVTFSSSFWTLTDCFSSALLGRYSSPNWLVQTDLSQPITELLCLASHICFNLLASYYLASAASAGLHWANCTNCMNSWTDSTDHNCTAQTAVNWFELPCS